MKHLLKYEELAMFGKMVGWTQLRCYLTAFKKEQIIYGPNVFVCLRFMLVIITETIIYKKCTYQFQIDPYSFEICI